MSVSEKIIEIKKIIELVVSTLPEIINLIKELIICVREIKTL